MLEKLLERMKEISEAFDQMMANLNALSGAKQELQSLITWHEEQANLVEAPKDENTGEVV